MAKTPEGAVVAYAKKRLKEKGCLVRKMAYEGRRGAPDMLVLVPDRLVPVGDAWDQANSCVIFIEFKKDETTEPEPHQLREHGRMRAVGADVRVIDSAGQVEALVEELFPCE